MPIDPRIDLDRRLAPLRTPHDVQRLLESIPYSTDPIYRCPLRTLRDRRAHCVDGALLAAAALRRLGHPPRVVWIHAENDDGHLIAVYRRAGRWGALAKSNFVGLRLREPVYRSLRELVMSYFNEYVNTRGELSMRAHTAALDLARFDRLRWEIDSSRLEAIIDGALDRVRRFPVAPAALLRGLPPVDERTLKAEMLGSDPKGLFTPEPAPARPKVSGPRRGPRASSRSGPTSPAPRRRRAERR